MGRGLSRARVLPVAAMLVTGALAAGTAHAEPSNRTLVVTGLGLAPPTYLVGVSLHEGSHALAALLVGAEVDTLHLFPPGRDPGTGTFRFGWTYVHGLASRGDRLAFFIAPKITDAALLGGFAGLVFTGAWPRNRYGELALTVFATGLWIDFSKDVVLFASTNDVVKVFELMDATGWKQVAARLVYAGVAAGLGLIVVHSYERTFERASSPGPMTVPLVATAF